MPKNCPLCESTNLSFHTTFPDKMNNQVGIEICNDCQCFVPQYGHQSSQGAIKQQTDFHEAWWKDSTAAELNKTLADLVPVVKDLQAYLGEPSPENIVIEIGSGRGSLLRALLDIGYHAYGCEPANGLVRLARKHYSLDSGSLYEMSADDFLEKVTPTLATAPTAILLWHVLEHLEHPMPLLHKLQSILATNGRLILQLPLISQEYVYPEHYFFATHNTFYHLASALNLDVELISYDSDNLFVTACLKKSRNAKSSSKIEFLSTNSPPSGMTQGVLLRDDLILALRRIIKDRDITISAYKNSTEEYISCIESQADLINERVLGMEEMEKMIKERDITIEAQAAIVDEKILAAEKMEQMIKERDITIEAQAAIVDEKILAVEKMEQAIKERDINLSQLGSAFKSTQEELCSYKNSTIVKIARKVRILK